MFGNDKNLGCLSMELGQVNMPGLKLSLIIVSWAYTSLEKASWYSGDLFTWLMFITALLVNDPCGSLL